MRGIINYCRMHPRIEWKLLIIFDISMGCIFLCSSISITTEGVFCPTNSGIVGSWSHENRVGGFSSFSRWIFFEFYPSRDRNLIFDVRKTCTERDFYAISLLMKFCSFPELSLDLGYSMIGSMVCFCGEVFPEIVCVFEVVVKHEICCTTGLCSGKDVCCHHECYSCSQEGFCSKFSNKSVKFVFLH